MFIVKYFVGGKWHTAKFELLITAQKFIKNTDLVITWSREAIKQYEVKKS